MRKIAKPNPIAIIDAMNSSATAVPKWRRSATRDSSTTTAHITAPTHRQEDRLATSAIAVRESELGEQPVMFVAAAVRMRGSTHGRDRRSGRGGSRRR